MKQKLIKSLLTRAVDRVNKGVSKTLTARRSSETPPMDSRHLTDTRTRVSTLLEYSLAYEMNILLSKEGKGFSVSAVLWNVFPDLFLRDKSRYPVIGFEVKALHTAAEEKSANLSTPLHVIKKGSDFVVIVIWAWQREVSEGVSVTYPHIHLVEVFDAYLLAQIRDYSWLFSQAGRIKGIDISSPLITPENLPKGDRVKAEEGNMGKLMRIGLADQMPETVPNYIALKAESSRYEQFKKSVLSLGLKATFLEICELQKAQIINIEQMESYPDKLLVVGTARLANASLFLLLAGGVLSAWMRKSESKQGYADGTTAIWLSSKLNWQVVRFSQGAWLILATGDKPDTAYESISNALAETNK